MESSLAEPAHSRTVRARFGFMETPDVTEGAALRAPARVEGIDEDISFFLGWHLLATDIEL